MCAVQSRLRSEPALGMHQDAVPLLIEIGQLIRVVEGRSEAHVTHAGREPPIAPACADFDVGRDEVVDEQFGFDAVGMLLVTKLGAGPRSAESCRSRRLSLFCTTA